MYIDISKVMKNRTSSAKPADYCDVVFPYIFTVDLRGGMLVASDNDGGSISPQPENGYLQPGQ